MKWFLLFAALATSCIAYPNSIHVSAQRGSGNVWKYSLTNLNNNSTSFPVYFSLPTYPEIGVTAVGLETPPGWGVFGFQDGNGNAQTLSFAAGEGATTLQMPQVGATLTGFELLTSVPTVLSTQGILFGFGEFTTFGITSKGVVAGPVPVLGTTQVTADINLQNFNGEPSNLRYGQLIFTGPGLPHYALATVDSQGTLLCSGPATPGTYAVTLQFFGYLQRRMLVTVAANECTFSATLIPGDCDGSQEIDAADIDMVIAAFGATDGGVEDLDGSLEVDAADIDICIANFGAVGD